MRNAWTISLIPLILSVRWYISKGLKYILYVPRIRIPYSSILESKIEFEEFGTTVSTLPIECHPAHGFDKYWIIHGNTKYAGVRMLPLDG